MKTYLQMDSSDRIPPFLRLTPELRQKIYGYLLPPPPEEDVTTINYDLEWPFLQHPSSTTFSPHQLDRCMCRQQQKHHSKSRRFEAHDHIYTRYICHGPQVIFRPKRKSFWVLQNPGSAFNVLRPATEEEIQNRPEAGIILVNRLIYREALPFLYRGRNFLLLTGICSRGRYQAYATEKWLYQLSPFARSQITALSLLCQSNEEDCRDLDALKAYRSLSLFIVEKLPRFRSLCLNVWPSDAPLYAFGLLFRKDGLHISLMQHDEDGCLYVFRDAWPFLQHCGGAIEEELLSLFWKYECERTDLERILDDSLELRQW